MAKRVELKWDENRGRNGVDPPGRILPGQVREAFNVAIVQGALGRKRYGSSAVAISGTYSGFVQIGRYVPGQNDSAAEVFAVSNDATTKIGRIAAGTAFANLTLKDAVASRPQDIYFVNFNGKYFLFGYDSTVNRGQIYDPLTSTSEIRRMGLATPAAATVANTGSGSYAAVLRYYRIQWARQVASATYLKSNLGSAVSFTPSGSGTHARVTRPTAASEGESHWSVWVSADNLVFYKLSGEIAIATTTYDDNALAAVYASGEAAPEEGAYTPFPSCRFGMALGDRIVAFGVLETASGDSHVPKSGQAYFTPSLDTTSNVYADDERCSNSLTFRGSISLSRNAGAEDWAVAGPLYGEGFFFQSRGITALTPTGQATQPFRRTTISDVIGAVNQASTFMGEDEQGRACIYFLDPARGPYRYGARGLEWLNYDNQDIWATFNPAAATRTAIGVYDYEAREAQWMIATGSSDLPNTPLKFSVADGKATSNAMVRYGWTTGTVARTDGTNTGLPYCVAMLPATIGATMSRKLKPYSGHVTSDALLKLEDDTATSDNLNKFQSYIDSPSFDANSPTRDKQVGHSDAWLYAIAASGVTIKATIAQDFGAAEDRVWYADLTPKPSTQTRVNRRFDAAGLAEVSAFTVRLGDADVIANAWTLDRFIVEIEVTDRPTK